MMEILLNEIARSQIRLHEIYILFDKQACVTLFGAGDFITMDN